VLATRDVRVVRNVCIHAELLKQVSSCSDTKDWFLRHFGADQAIRHGCMGQCQ
jgi:hypothetical protein